MASDPSDSELLHDLRAKREWLRAHPTGMLAAGTKQSIKKLEREAALRGLGVDDTATRQASTAGQSIWYVVDVKEPNTKRSLHLDRECTHLVDSQLREATERERETLVVCSSCS